MRSCGGGGVGGDGGGGTGVVVLTSGMLSCLGGACISVATVIRLSGGGLEDGRASVEVLCAVVDGAPVRLEDEEAVLCGCGPIPVTVVVCIVVLLSEVCVVVELRVLEANVRSACGCWSGWCAVSL